MTNLKDTITTEELVDIYYQRGEIEKKYHILKNKLKFESIAGKASIYVYPDFLAQFLAYQIMQDIRKRADEVAATIGKKNGNKYPMHTNKNVAIGLFKKYIIRIILESQASKQFQKLEKLQQEMECCLLPIPKLPSTKRKKNISNKYKNNQKNSFYNVYHSFMGRFAHFLCVLNLYNNHFYKFS